MIADLTGKTRDWFRERREKLDLFDETLVGKQDNPIYLMGPLLYYFWLLTVVTGLVLMIWYEPTTTGAYSSIERIQHDVPLGWLIRGLHKYGADALITDRPDLLVPVVADLRSGGDGRLRGEARSQ